MAVTPRYRRVNIDGKSTFKTETRVMNAALYPGTVVEINSADKFVAATAASGKRLYVLNPAEHEGLSITEQIPAGDSGVGNYLEEGREFAVRVAAGAYTKDQPLTIVSGAFAAVPSAAGTYPIVGYSQDTVTTTDTDFIRVRIQTGDTVTNS